MEPRVWRRSAAFISACFFFAGFTAVVHHFVWFHTLSLVLGGAALTSALLVGIALGSFIGVRWADKAARPLLFYGALQLFIGLYLAVSAPLSVRAVTLLYSAVGSDAGPLLLAIVRLAVAALVLILPAIAAGASLPALSRCFVRRRESAGTPEGWRIGRLFALAAAGAALGALAPMFVLAPAMGIRSSGLLAASLNVAVGAIAVLLGRRTPAPEGRRPVPDATESPTHVEPRWHAAIALAGLGIAALAASSYFAASRRFLASLVPATAYAFAILSATWLLGLAVGAVVGSHVGRESKNRLFLMGAAQLFAAVAAYAAIALYKELPYRFALLQEPAFGTSGVSAFPLLVVSAALVFLPATFAGAVFPLAIQSCTRDVRRVGAAVGSAVGVGALGCLTGFLAAPLVLLPELGLMSTFALSSALALALAVVLVVSSSARGFFKKIAVAASLLALVNVFAFRPDFDFFPAVGYYRSLLGVTEDTPRDLVFRRRLIVPEAYALARRDGTRSSVAVIEGAGGHRSLLVDGRWDGSTSADMASQLLAAAVPFAVSPAEEALIAGFITGATAGLALEFPDSRVAAADPEPAVIEFSRFFQPTNLSPLDDRDGRVTLRFNDLRNHLLVSDRLYDVIISQPGPPFAAGATHLFSAEFYKLARSRLKPDGLFCQRVRTSQTTAEAFAVMLRTFDHAFESVYVFQIGLSDYLFVGTREPLWIDADAMEERISGFVVRQVLARASISSPSELLATFLLGPQQVKEFLSRGPQIKNTDDNLWLALEAPKGFWLREPEADILSALLDLSPGEYPYIKYPGGDEQRVQWLIDAAEWRLRGGHLDLAQRIAERALSIGFDARVHDLLARLHLARGGAQAAEEEWGLILSRDPDHVPTLLARAGLAARTGDLESALPPARRVLELEPANSLAHFYVGVNLHRQGKIDDALTHFEAAAREEAIRARPEILYSLAATELEPSVARYESARTHMGRYLQFVPMDYTAWYHLGAAQYVTASVQEAAASWRRAASLAGTLADSYLRRGAEAWSDGDLPTAAAAFKQAITLFGSDRNTHREMEQVVWKLGDSEEIVGAAQRAVEAFPDDPNVHLQLAAAYEHAEEPQPALESYRKAIELEENLTALAQIEKSVEALKSQFPELSDSAVESEGETAGTPEPHRNSAEVTALLEKAKAALEAGDADSALQEARSALELDPQSPAAHFYAGLALFSLGEVSEAVVRFESALADEAFVEEQPALLYNLAVCYLNPDIARYEEAVPLLRSYLRERPADHLANYHFGAALYLSGQHDPAFRAWEKGYLLSVARSEDLLQRARAALAVGDRLGAEMLVNVSLQAFPFNAGSLTELATLRSAVGDHQAAVNALNRVVEVTPSDKRVYYSLAQEHEAAGDIEAAMLNYKRYAVLESDPSVARDVKHKLAQLRALLPPRPLQVRPLWEGVPGIAAPQPEIPRGAQ